MTLIERVQPVLRRLEATQWIPQLLVRLFVGGFFALSGWGKTHNLAQMTERFRDWGIPLPAFNAALSAYAEQIFGALVVLGLLTRLSAIPLVINMIVAIVSVKLAKVSGLSDLLDLDEPLYALAFLWLIFSGPGKASLDHLIVKAMRKGAAPAPAPATAAVAAR